MPGDSRRDVGAANPRALAELRAGQQIEWTSENTPKMLEKFLDVPYKQLFDPKFGSPIYAGVPLDFSHKRCPIQVDPRIDIKDLFDRVTKSATLVENGLVSRSVLNEPTTNVRLFAAGRPIQSRPVGQSNSPSPAALRKWGKQRLSRRANRSVHLIASL